MKLSRLFVRAAVLLTVIVFPQFIPPTAAQAAPGDLLFTSGGASNVYGLGVDTSGNIYVPDRYQVKVYDSSGAFVKSLGFTPPTPLFYYASAVAVDSTGKIYVAEGDNTIIYVLNSDGSFHKRLSTRTPYRIVLDSNDKLYIVSPEDYVMQVVDNSGNSLRQWGAMEQFGPSRPWGIAVDKNGNIYVTSRGTYNKIWVYDSEGNFIRQMGEGMVAAPDALAVDSNGNVYVTDSGQIVVLDQDGRLRAKWPGSGATGITVDPAAKVYVAYSGYIEVLEGFKDRGVPPAKPDLVVKAMITPPSATQGQHFSVPVTVRNLGAVAAGKFTVSVYAASGADSGALLGSVPVQALAATAEYTAVVPVTPTSYLIQAVVDSANAVAEAEESNNIATQFLFMGGATKADLALTALTAPAGLPGQQVNVPVTVKNQGWLPAQYFSVSVFLSNDGTIGTNDSWIGGAWVNALDVWESRTINVPVTLPPSGTYYLGAIADPDNDVAEVNETNNALGKELVVSSDADLVVTAVAAPSSAKAGQQIIVPVTVKNQGASAAYYFNLAMYVAPKGGFTTAGTWIGGAWVTSIAPGAAKTFNVSVFVPQLNAGTYDIGALADPGNYIAERSESNNTLVKPIAITR